MGLKNRAPSVFPLLADSSLVTADKVAQNIPWYEFAYPYAPSSTSTLKLVHIRHNRRANVLTFDGAARAYNVVSLANKLNFGWGYTNRLYYGAE
jgi:prepilin-type processing-associated H-X9-DG protein